jgi:GNAT superfamily N-acetyltransferase
MSNEKTKRDRVEEVIQTWPKNLVLFKKTKTSLRIEVRALNLLNPQELDAVIQLNLLEWGAQYFGTEAEAIRITQKAYADPARHTLVTVLIDEDKETVIGAASVVERDVYGVYPDKNIRAENLGYFSRLVIAEAYRGQGLGRQLLEEADRLADKLGFNELYLFMTEGRESNLYTFYMNKNWTETIEKELPGFGKCLVLTHAVPKLAPVLRPGHN